MTLCSGLSSSAGSRLTCWTLTLPRVSVQMLEVQEVSDQVITPSEHQCILT